MKENIKVVAFDADDTLWDNEIYFQETEKNFCNLMQEYLPKEEVSKELFKTEMQNLPIYGFGIKGFALSMIETALRISDNKISPQIINQIIELEKELLNKPVEILEGVVDVLNSISRKFKIVVATKGDLLDQERKLNKSGLECYFDHIEIMSDKKNKDYLKLMKHLKCNLDEFLMIGNSLKSDILPILEIGGYAAYIPYHVTWTHEIIDNNISDSHYIHLSQIKDILEYL